MNRYVMWICQFPNLLLSKMTLVVLRMTEVFIIIATFLKIAYFCDLTVSLGNGYWSGHSTMTNPGKNLKFKFDGWCHHFIWWKLSQSRTESYHFVSSPQDIQEVLAYYVPCIPSTKSDGNKYKCIYRVKSILNSSTANSERKIFGHCIIESLSPNVQKKKYYIDQWLLMGS